MIKKLAAAVLAATAVAGLAACAPATSDRQVSSADAKSLTIWTTANGPAKELFTGYGKSFEAAHPGVTVNIQYMADADVKQKVQAALVAKNLPEIVAWYGGSFLTPLVQASALADLSGYIKADTAWRDGLLPRAFDNYTVDGKTYMVPTESPIVEMFYNKDLFAKAGVTRPPTTLDEFLADVRKFKDAGIVPVTLDGKDGWPLQQWYTYLAMRNGGPALIGDALAGKTEWTAPPFTLAAKQLKQIIDAGAFQKGYLGTGYDEAMADFYGGQAAMVLSGTWIMSSLTAEENKAALARTGTFDFPLTGGSGTIADVQGGPNGALGISATAPDKALAWEFVKGATSGTEAAKLAEQALLLMPNKITYDRTAVPDLFNRLVDKLAGYTGYNLFWNEILPAQHNTEFTNLQNSLATGDITPEKMTSDFAAYMKAHPVGS
ncbi:ABC transporter substrate-binding protein [Streptosporangium sp. CA-135522]|uniref:ABC transporter substrate-binding protein n=1 Tax=Streptosporangium sp. CA-135522 TaxID=3240072 RepID=UPI003D941AAD